MAESLDLFVVEDDEHLAFILRTALERAGHRVTTCRSGADALTVLAQRQFHLVLLDQMLPDMAGLDLLRTLTRDGVATPVLMVTGHGSEKLVTDALHAGALDYVVKDSSRAFLADLPKRVLESVTRYRLQQNNRLLVGAVESARDGVVISDLRGEVLHVNGALERMLGFPREELLGQSLRRLESEQSSDAFYEEMWRTVLDRRSWQGELACRRKDETLLDTSLTVSPIFDARGQMTHVVSIYRDISDRKQMERQLFQAQKMQSVGTLAGGVAHEFNNLLAGIQGYATLALREPDAPPSVREFLDFIVQLSDRAANLTRQLLAFARKPALVRQPASLARLLEGTADLVRRSLNIDVALDLEPAGGAEWMALADTNQLQQVLVNLSMNARDAMPHPQPAPVAFRLLQRSLPGELPAFPQNVPAGDWLVIEVEDRGSGMPPAVLAQALDPFFTTKEVGQGTGLGLAVAFGIITGHQGYLALESTPGKGTTVRLFLPRLLQESPSGVSAPSPVLEPEPVPARCILVVDDEKAVIDVVHRFLNIAGHAVSSATSGKQALEFLGRHADVDLVILDLMIPKEEGVETFRQIRQLRPGLPILLCTGLVQSEQANELLRQGAASLLRKPFRMNELWYAVSRCLGEPAARTSSAE